MAVATPEIISLANTIVVHVGLPRKVETLKQCNSTLFSQLYEALTGSRVPGLALQAPTSEAVKCQAVVDALNVHLFPHVILDHIRGIEVAQLDPLSIKNLLDVFSVLFHIPPPSSSDSEEASKDGGHHYYSENNDNELENGNDSNVISSEGMSVISEVLREELGHSSHSAVTDSTTELVRPVPTARLPTRLLTTVPAAKQEQTHRDVQCSARGENYSVVSQSNESSATNSQPASLMISSLQTTSTEAGSSYHERVTPQARGTPQDAVTADGTNRKQDQADASSRATETKAPVSGFVPSGESSIGTTPSPKLHTPPQSPQQHHQISPLHHSTPHTSTWSRLFPFSSSTSTAISSHTPARSHPLSTATVTPSVTVTHKQISQPERRPSSWREGEKLRPIQEQDTQSTLVTDESTLVPESPPSPHAYPRQIPELTITDLHTTTMSSGGGGASEQVGGALKTAAVDAHRSFSEDSYSTCSETPPEQLSPQKVAQSLRPPPPHTSKPPSVRTAATTQKVRFTQSAERTERASHGGSLTTASSDHSSTKIGELSSVRLNLGLNTRGPQSRASVLATLYQNYLSDLKTAHPATETAKKARADSKSKPPKSYSRPMSKVASLKHQKHVTRKESKKVAAHPHTCTERARWKASIEINDEESSSGSEREQRPPTPTEIAVGDNMFPLIERDFPFIHVSPPTLRRLRQKQLQQVTALTRSRVSQRTGAVKKMAEMEQKQKAQLHIIKKELDHTKRMQRQLEQKREKVAVKSSIRAKRQAAARARRYFIDYELSLKAKLQRRRTREEQIFRQTFEEGLELQREKIRELKRYAKEKQEEHTKRHQDQLESMENYYRDQLAMLSDSMLKERTECAIRDKAQNQMVHKMKRELREKIESEIKELQQCLDREEDIAHFRELDAQAVRHKLSRITFTATVK